MTGPAGRVRATLARLLGRPPRGEAAEVVGLVLAGGGSRASFEIGALRYLYDREGIEADVIAGTSVGSVLGSVIAQYPDHAGQRGAVEALERVWRELRTSDDMFAPLPWFTALQENMPAWRRLARLRERATTRTSLTSALGAVLHGPRAVADRTREVHQPPPEHAHTGTDGGPMELLSTLFEVGRTGRDLDAVVRGASTEQSAFRVGPIMQRLLDPDVFDPARTAHSGVVLRVAVVQLESGELRYVDGLGHLRDATDRRVPGEAPVDLVSAILASCAIPSGLPPVRLGDAHYVDGGTRENVPVRIAFEHLGVSRCYVVVPNPPDLPRRDSYRTGTLTDIVARAAEIMPSEIQADEVARARELGATVIDAELDVHDILTVDPGLVAIAMDYGWMRAAEVCRGAPGPARARTRDVINLRRLIWSTEVDLLASDPPEAGTQDVARLKHRLRDLVRDTDPDLLPPGAQQWWRSWEGHTFAVDTEPGWLATEAS